MKFNKFILFIFVFFGLIGGVSAIQNDTDLKAHWELDNLTDSSGNSNTLINSPPAVSSSVCYRNDCYDFDGIDDQMTSSLGIDFTSDFTISMWFASDSFSKQFFEVAIDGSNSFRLTGQSSGNPYYMYYTGQGVSNNGNLIGLNTLADSTFYNLQVVYLTGSNEIKFYKDTILVATHSFTNDLVGSSGTFKFRTNYDGKFDESSIWARALNSSERTDLYLNNISYLSSTPQIIIDDVNLINNTITNQSTLNIGLNLSAVNTNTLINTTLYLSNGSSYVIGSNTQNVSFNLLGIQESTLNLWTFSENNETNVTSSNFTYFFDFTNPVIQTLNNISSNSFEINFSTIFNVTDAFSGLSSCIINITELENVTTPDNQVLNCTDTQTFTTPGLHNLLLTATDNAGNVNILNENFTINPLINIFFTQLNGSIVLDYSPTLFHPDGRITTPTVQSDGALQLSPVNNESLDLGNHTIQFSKLGFSTENFTQIVNETNAGINVTFNVTDSKIVIRVFDRETNALLTGLTSITIQASVGFNGTTTTGLLNVSDLTFISEQYQILAEHIGYNTENVFFNYNNQEIINIDIFMLNSTAVEEGQIKIIVKNSLSQFVESTVCSALEWRPSESAFVSVAQGLTNVIGETLLNIELNTKIYKFSCTKDTFTTITNAQIVQIDASSLTIILNDVILAPTTLFPNLVTSLTNTTLNATHQLVTYTFADSDGLTTEACLKVFLVNGNRQTFNSENCVSSATGTLLLTVNINQTSDILIQGTLTTSEVTDYISDTLTFKGVGDIAGQFKNIGLDILIPTMLILLGLGLGILLSKIEIAVVFIAIAGWISVAFVPTILKSSIAMFISVIVALMLWGGFNRK